MKYFLKAFTFLLVFLIACFSNSTYASIGVILNNWWKTCNTVCSSYISCVLVGYDANWTNSQRRADDWSSTGWANCGTNILASQYTNCRCCMSPTNGWWTARSWSSCNVFTGIQSWNRSCTNPAPSCWWVACVWNSSTTQACLVNWLCGSSAWWSYITAPTTNLCSAGTTTSVINNNSRWEWTCLWLNWWTSPLCIATIPYQDIWFKIFDWTQVVNIAIEPTWTVTSPLRIAKNWTIYWVVLVDTTDSMASNMRVNTSTWVKALRKL